MRKGVAIEIRRLLLLALFLVLVGSGYGYPILTLLIGLSIYLVWTVSKISEIYQWLESGAKGLPPQSDGIWSDLLDNFYRQKQRNRRSKQLLRNAVRRVGQMTEALEEGIVVLTPDRTLDWWNSSGGDLLGLKKVDRGSPIVNLLRSPEFIEYLQIGNYSSRIEIASPVRIGGRLLISASLFGEDEMVLVVQDVTRLRNLEEMRKEFVANISHELRTPLTVLMGYLETLDSLVDTSKPATQRVLKSMEGQTARIKSLADDLVMLSKLEAQEHKASRDLVPLQPLLESIVPGAEVLSAGAHKISLTCEDGLAVRGSKDELYTAISNLVFNAIRHNPDGANVAISAMRAGDRVRVEVTDDGVGIDPIHIPRLTERFYRIDRGRGSSVGGTGLGLAIVKHVLQRHGAQLEIVSYPGKGARFICTF